MQVFFSPAIPYNNNGAHILIVNETFSIFSSGINRFVIKIKISA